jgi:hypothetical protein
MAMKIFILEDNAERRDAMRDCVRDRFHQFEACFFVEAEEMIAAFQQHLGETILISLDHDLEPQEATKGTWIDPGDGRMVADFLAQRPAVCPVIVHTSNSPAAAGMIRVLDEAGWITHRVAPYFDIQWIAQSWFPTVRQAIVDSAARVGAALK